MITKTVSTVRLYNLKLKNVSHSVSTSAYSCIWQRCLCLFSRHFIGSAVITWLELGWWQILYVWNNQKMQCVSLNKSGVRSCSGCIRIDDRVIIHPVRGLINTSSTPGPGGSMDYNSPSPHVEVKGQHQTCSPGLTVWGCLRWPHGQPVYLIPVKSQCKLGLRLGACRFAVTSVSFKQEVRLNLLGTIFCSGLIDRMAGCTESN